MQNLTWYQQEALVGSGCLLPLVTSHSIKVLSIARADQGSVFQHYQPQPPWLVTTGDEPFSLKAHVASD